MHKIIRGLVAIALAGLAWNANAIVVTYGFTATLQKLTLVSSGGGNQTDVDSSTLPGALVSTGEKIVGRVYYDTGAILSGTQPSQPSSGTQQSYGSDSANTNIEFFFVNTGLLFGDSGSPPNSSIIQVGDDNSDVAGADTLFIGAISSKLNQVTFSMLSLRNLTGLAVQGGGIPPALEAFDLSSAALAGIWINQSSNEALAYWATLDSLWRLESADVPEPGSLAMLMLGLAALGVARLRHRTV
ncbi:MAG: PEP-CTERM sorting domain-containing protein [Pseudomonadota bacterium]